MRHQRLPRTSSIALYAIAKSRPHNSGAAVSFAEDKKVIRALRQLAAQQLFTGYFNNVTKNSNALTKIVEEFKRRFPLVNGRRPCCKTCKFAEYRATS